MKNLLVILFVFLSQTGDYKPAQTDIGEKIHGQWVFDKIKSVEQLPNGVFADRQSGPLEKMTVYFKSDNTGNFNFADKDSEKFTWIINKNKITINYSGESSLCKSFNGDFKTILRDRKGSQKLELIRSNFSISLYR
jgi:hypothetical protein